MPGVVYGEGTRSEPVSVNQKEFEKVFREAGESSVVILKMDGGEELNVMIHDVAYDPLTANPIHADFYSVRMDKEIETKVPFIFVGESAAVKNDGGILVKVMHEIEVSALPKDLPREIVVDTAHLGKIGDRIRIKDLTFPSGVKIEIDADEIVALIEAPRSEEELKTLEGAVAPEVTEVKTEREVKLEEKVSQEVQEAEEKTVEG